MTQNESPTTEIFDCYTCDTRNVLSPIDHELARHDGAQTVWLRGTELTESDVLND